jgi:solute carrier family 25 folate transporter 32
MDKSKSSTALDPILQRQYVISSLVAGVGSGAMASIVCAPLDLVRTRMQVLGGLASATPKNTSTLSHPMISHGGIVQTLRGIYLRDGFKGCFRGLGATMATVPAFWGLYFPLYEETKRELHHLYLSSQTTAQQNQNNNGDEVSNRVPPQVHMVSAIMAGAAADVVCNPMFLVRTRMQTEALHYMELPPSDRVPHNLRGTISAIWKEGKGSPFIFWRGMTASLMGLSHVAIQFPVYEWFKAEARGRSETNEESTLDLLVSSGASKMCASMITYPHEVIRSRMMDARGPMGVGIVGTFQRILRDEGPRAFYAGLHVSLLRVVPNCCITFMSYELILRWAKENVCRKDP